MNIGAPPPPPNNRRRAFRLDVTFPVMLSSLRGNHKCKALDLSAGGMRLRVPGKLMVGTRVDLRFDLDTTPVEVKAEVLREIGQQAALPRDYGVQFVDLRPGPEARIVKYLNEQQAQMIRMLKKDD